MNFKKSDLKNEILKIFSNKNFSKYAVICGISGILLIFISSFIKNENKSSENKHTNKFYLEQKREKLEKNLENIISGINGAGKCKVLVTFETGPETIYATEERLNKEASEDKEASGEITRKRKTNDIEKKFITVKDSQGTEHALAVTEVEPKIKGVVIICPGGDDVLVKKRIVDATTTALNINSNHVCVVKSV